MGSMLTNDFFYTFLYNKQINGTLLDFDTYKNTFFENSDDVEVNKTANALYNDPLYGFN